MALKIERNVDFTFTAIFDSSFQGREVYARIYNTANNTAAQESDSETVGSDGTVEFSFTATQTNSLDAGWVALELYILSEDTQRQVWMASLDKFGIARNTGSVSQ